MNKKFQIEDLYSNDHLQNESGDSITLDEKLRQAYFWITNTAIISPYYDIEFNEGDPKSFYLETVKYLFIYQQIKVIPVLY